MKTSAAVKKEENPMTLVKEEEAPKPTLKSLFVAYEEADGLVEEAQKALQEAIAARSQAVHAVLSSYGKGPYEWRGHKMTAVSRGETHFFRGERKGEITKVV
jgi:hypothetical protein